MIPTYLLNLRIEDVVVDTYTVERRPDGYVVASGTCKVVPEEDDTFTMEFTYKGRSSEDSSEILDFLHHLGCEKYQERLAKGRITLLQFCHTHSKEDV